MNFFMVYTTARNEEEARLIANTLLSKHLIACANIFNIRSLYHWKGNIEDEEEAAIIMKTTEDHCEVIIKEIKSVHSYEVPCVEFFPITNGNPDFLEWIKNETSV